MQDVAGELMARGRQVAVARVTGVDDNMVRPHRHDHLEIYLLEQGQRDHLSGGEVHRMRAPEVIIFPPGDEHYSWSPPGLPFRRVVVYARPEAVLYPHALEAVSRAARVVRPTEAGLAAVRALVDQLLYTQEELGERSQDEMRLQLTQLLLLLDRQQDVDTASAARETRIVRVVRRLHERYREHVDLSELAEEFFVSRHHLSREFRRHTGTTVISYVNDLRIDQARRLLVETEHPIGHIAEEVGFTTVTHFNRVFRERTGCTPRSIRAERPAGAAR